MTRGAGSSVFFAVAGVVAGEVVSIALLIDVRRLLCRCREPFQVLRVRRRHDQRLGLDAQHVVGRCRALLAVPVEILAVDEVLDLRPRAEVHDHEARAARPRRIGATAATGAMRAGRCMG